MSDNKLDVNENDLQMYYDKEEREKLRQQFKQSFDKLTTEFTNDLIPPNEYEKHETILMYTYDAYHYVSLLSKCVFLYNKNPELLKLAIEDKENLEKDETFEHYALTYATLYSTFLGNEPVKMLIPKMNKKQISKALFIACDNECFTSTIESIKLLIDAGADVNFIDKNDGKTPLMAMCSIMGHNDSYRDYSFMQLLFDRGADIYIKDKAGNSILHYLRYDYQTLDVFIKRFGYKFLLQFEDVRIKNLDNGSMCRLIKNLILENEELKSMKSLIKNVSPLDAMMLQYYK
jgi:hypothetical protein